MRLRRLIGWFTVGVGLVMTFSGCAHTIGYAGEHPGYIRCAGKGTITGTASGALIAGYGGSNLGTFTISGDCGDGFVFQQGKDPIAKP